MFLFYLQHLLILVVRSLPTITISTIFCCIRWPPVLSGIKCIWNTMLSKFPGSEFCALVPRPGLINPHMNRNSFIMRQINWCGYCSIINAGKPSGIAMSKYIHRFSFLFFTDAFNQLKSMNSYLPAVFLFRFTNFKSRFKAFSDNDCRMEDHI